MRLQIHTTEDVVKAIDERAARIGISRNAMCAVLLHNAVFGEGSPGTPGDGPAGGPEAFRAEPGDKEEKK